MRPQFEPSNTIQFTFVSSVAPDSAPTFKVTGTAGTVISSITALSSDSTHYYALFTAPSSEGVYKGEWFAQKTVSGSAYNFTRSLLFNVFSVQRTL